MYFYEIFKINLLLIILIILNSYLPIIILYLNGKNDWKGTNLNKKDIKIGSKIKVLYCSSALVNKEEYRYFLIEMENKDVTLLDEKEQVLEYDKTYLLNSKRNWEKVV
jgi:hypothetical protein